MSLGHQLFLLVASSNPKIAPMNIMPGLMRLRGDREQHRKQWNNHQKGVKKSVELSPRPRPPKCSRPTATHFKLRFGRQKTRERKKIRSAPIALTRRTSTRERRGQEREPAHPWKAGAPRKASPVSKSTSPPRKLRPSCSLESRARGKSPPSTSVRGRPRPFPLLSFRTARPPGRRSLPRRAREGSERRRRRRP